MNDQAPVERSDRAWRRPKLVAGFIIAVAVMLAGDLYLKVWAFDHVAGSPVELTGPGSFIPPHPPRVLVPSVLALKLTLNEGALFGLGQGYAWLFALFSIAAVGIIGYMFATSSRRARWTHVALALVLAGALGNLYDRITVGAVRDMLYLLPGVNLPFGWSWGGGQTGLYPWIFNGADVLLVVGLAMLAIRIVFGEKKSPDTGV